MKTLKELIAENPIVRGNLMKEENYTGYCGSDPKYRCSCPRTRWISSLNQFQCPECNWISSFPIEFINHYKQKWNK